MERVKTRIPLFFRIDKNNNCLIVTNMYANKVKKIAAVHDLSGMGRVSLTVVIPILSSMGFQVCPLPTAV